MDAAAASSVDSGGSDSGGNLDTGHDSAAALQAGLDSKPLWSKEEVDKRCAGTKGSWCRGYYEQQPIPAKLPPSGNKTCLWGCNFVGVCDHLAGWCRCPAGWTGDDCTTRLRRPCSWRVRPHGFEPFDAAPDLTQQAGLNSRCAQLCDEDIGYCFCNSTWKHGHELAPPDAPPGTPPARRGRPLGMHCQPKKSDPAHMDWGDTDPEDLWGPEGWCTADKPKFRCPCILDGYGGEYCDQYREAFCPNQCNGHGECNLGFCQCHTGWWGHDCAYRSSGTAWSSGYEAGERPWIEGLVDTPAARDVEPGQTRLRPLIYVYELPAIFNAVMLQYRVDHGTCVHRLFRSDNSSIWNDGWGYVAETALHEALLQSRHRTLDPEEADLFYIPVYSSCYLHPIHGFSDSPFFHSFHNIPRVHGAVNMLIEAHAWIRSHFPWWDRHGGRDHIVLQTHDEGSCWLPAVLRSAILLTHWGRMDAGHVSSTGYGPDNYTFVASHPLYMPEGTQDKLGDFPCYDPEKDLVIPPMTSAQKYRASPLVGAPARERSIFAFFKGRTQQNNPRYSRGIRQTLENLCRGEKWWETHGIWIGQGNPPGLEERGYTETLASSIFCFVLPGDGFSPRFEDAVHHGCIPVIIQDNVHLGFESILDFDTFAIRIAEADMKRVPEILKAVPQEDITSKQRGLAVLWRKWAYTGYLPYGNLTKRFMEDERRKAGDNSSEPASLPHPERDYNPFEADAMEVIYAWLYSRIPHTRGPAKPQAAAADRSRKAAAGSDVERKAKEGPNPAEDAAKQPQEHPDPAQNPRKEAPKLAGEAKRAEEPETPKDNVNASEKDEAANGGGDAAKKEQGEPPDENTVATEQQEPTQ